VSERKKDQQANGRKSGKKIWVAKGTQNAKNKIGEKNLLCPEEPR